MCLAGSHVGQDFVGALFRVRPRFLISISAVGTPVRSDAMSFSRVRPYPADQSAPAQPRTHLQSVRGAKRDFTGKT